MGVARQTTTRVGFKTNPERVSICETMHDNSEDMVYGSVQALATSRIARAAYFHACATETGGLNADTLVDHSRGLPILEKMRVRLRLAVKSQDNLI